MPDKQPVTKQPKVDDASKQGAPKKQDAVPGKSGGGKDAQNKQAGQTKTPGK